MDGRTIIRTIGVEVLCAEIPARKETVRKWAQRGIPAEYWLDVARIAAAHGHPFITAEIVAAGRRRAA